MFLHEIKYIMSKLYVNQILKNLKKMYFVQFTILLILLNETFSSLINDKLNQGLKKIKDKPSVKIPKDVPRDRSKFSTNKLQIRLN